MGIGMPKFVTDGYASVKNTYYSFKSGCREIKDTFKMAKTAIKMARSLDTTKYSETKDPKDIIDALNSSGADIPETYKSLLKVIPEDTLKKLTNILFETFTKSKTFGSGGDTETSVGPTHRRPSNHTEFESPDFTTQESASEAIGRLTNAMTEKVNRSEDYSDRQQENMDHNPPTEYSEMKSDDDGESRFSNHSYNNEDEEKGQASEPFGIKNDNFNFRQTSHQNKQHSYDSEDASPFGSGENRYYRQKDRDQSERVSFQNQSAGEPEVKSDLPPLTKMLGEELHKRYGPNWRQKMPSFVHNPETTENLPDLGFGLNKETNRNMVLTVSRVLKDLL